MREHRRLRQSGRTTRVLQDSYIVRLGGLGGLCTPPTCEKSSHRTDSVSVRHGLLRSWNLSSHAAGNALPERHKVGDGADNDLLYAGPFPYARHLVEEEVEGDHDLGAGVFDRVLDLAFHRRRKYRRDHGTKFEGAEVRDGEMRHVGE